MKISVVISTYNGEKYVIEQLDSIKKQTRKPDEVIIKDDCSTDCTVQIIKNYIAENHLIKSWKLIENEDNMGWRKNFVELLKLATGDLVFLCDQDDIWMPEKVEKMSQIFLKNENIKLLVTDVEPLYEDENAPKLYLPEIGKSLLTKLSFNVHIFEIHRPGCTYCLRKELIIPFQKIWFSECAHDSVLWIVALCQDGLYSYKEQLIKFRRHDSNSTPINARNKKSKIDEITFKRKVINKLRENAEFLKLDEEKKIQLEKLDNYLKIRLDIISNQRILKIFGLLKYINYYPKKRSLLVDVMATFERDRK